MFLDITGVTQQLQKLFKEDINNYNHAINVKQEKIKFEAVRKIVNEIQNDYAGFIQKIIDN